MQISIESTNNQETIRSFLQTRLQSGRGVFAAYYMLGYPDYETSIEAMITTANEGADIIEIGLPFSDPIADGPVIQHAANVAIKNGISAADAWGAVRAIRKRTKALPLIMTYGNIPMQYGFADFAHHAYQAGIRGIILPDVPPQLFPAELSLLRPIYLASPLTSPERLEVLVKQTHGFLYVVSNLGITGEQRKFDSRLQQLAKHASLLNPTLPKLLGFGVHDSLSAHSVFSYGMDGVVVGSALLKALNDGGDIDALIDLVHDIASGLEKKG